MDLRLTGPRARPRRWAAAAAAVVVLAGAGTWTAAAASDDAPPVQRRDRVMDTGGARIDTSYFTTPGSERRPAVLLAHGFGASKDELRARGRGPRPRRIRRADLVGARLRPLHGQDRAQRPEGRGRRRVQAHRLAGETARGAARQEGRPARRCHRRLVRRSGLAARRRVRRPGRRHRPADHVLEPRRRTVPPGRLQEALGRALHQHRRRLRPVRAAAVPHVRARRRGREAGRRGSRPPRGALPDRRRQAHQGAHAPDAGPDRLPVPARPGRRGRQGDPGQRRACRRRLDRGRSRRRRPRDGARRSPRRLLVRPLSEGRQGGRHRPRLPRHPHRRHRLHRRRRPAARREQRHVPGPFERPAARAADRARAARRQPRRGQPARHLEPAGTRRRRRWRTRPALLPGRRPLPRLPRPVRPLRVGAPARRPARHRVPEGDGARRLRQRRRRPVRQGVRRRARRRFPAGAALPTRLARKGGGLRSRRRQGRHAHAARHRPRSAEGPPAAPRPVLHGPRLRVPDAPRHIHRLPQERPVRAHRPRRAHGRRAAARLGVVAAPHAASGGARPAAHRAPPRERGSARPGPRRSPAPDHRPEQEVREVRRPVRGP